MSVPLSNLAGSRNLSLSLLIPTLQGVHPGRILLSCVGLQGGRAMSNQPYGSQPAWIDGRTAEIAERERSFIRSVYGWMFGGLLLTAAAALWVVASPAMQQLIFGSRFMIW